MNALSYAELARAFLPEINLTVGALFVLGFDLATGRGKTTAQRLRPAVFFGMIAIIAALYATISAGVGGPVFGGIFSLDALTLATRLGVLLLAWLTLGLLNDVVALRHPAEYVAIILLATAGFTLMAGAQQLLVAFLALELASLALYILAGWDKTSPQSAEAALKYFLFGAMSAAFLLFGFSLLYGVTGSIDLPIIAMQISVTSMSPLVVVALAMIIVAFGYKAAAAPFHLWAPDAYQGAPASSAALIASASKLAGFVFFLRLLWPGLGFTAGRISELPLVVGWAPMVALLALASLLVGNFGALAQSNVRRLLAYSAIAHAGAMLLGVIAAGRAGPGPVFYYAATYGLATVGCFGVVAIVERAGRCQNLTDLAGLHKRSPLLAGCLAVFVLSLAGVPPLAGFFGKFSVFASALKLSGLHGPVGWLAFAAIALSAVGLYYYLLILKQALVAAPQENAATKIEVPVQAGLALLIAGTLIVLLGLFPSKILQLFS
ncbi:MAG: NADH-quinone oxidoreductase subunit N [Opitutae bacterium]|nr:NADH-quinone oxidoreductase subunit N [Opitutae bacterium]